MAGGLNVGTATTAPLVDTLNQSTQYSATPLPRQNFGGLFPPGVPLLPAPLNAPRTDTGQPDLRRSEFPVSANLTRDAQKLVPWTTLRAAADQVDIIRRCIQVRKVEQSQLDWDFTVDRRTCEAAGAKTSREKADLRSNYIDDIGHLVEFWQMPDRTNGFTWNEWLDLLLEEYFVVDALSIYPRMDLGGNLHSLEIIDGTTIKPLLDERGNRPAPPNPAYQQWLYGFPRGEYTDSGIGDWEATAGGLIYKPRHPRVWTPYGYSPTEQALVSADLWLRRQEWMRTEYTTGTLPTAFMKTNLAGYTPEQMRAWEDVLNDFLSGSSENRHKVKLLAEGFDPVAVADTAERYKPEYDEFLVKLLCAHIDVQPTEIGFTPRNGLGGKGHGEDAEDIGYRKAIRPTSAWLVSIVNHISRRYLGMPQELTAQFLGLESEDEEAADNVAKQRVEGARNTANEDRDRLGLDRYEEEWADKPFLMTMSGPVWPHLAYEQQKNPPPAPTGMPPGQQGDTPAEDAAEDNQAANQDTSKALEAPSTGLRPAADDAVGQICAQLSRDYPPDAYQWVRATQWSGPVDVPLSEVDFTRSDSWRAANEPDRVEKFAAKLRKGKPIRPVLLVRTPHSTKLVVVDGHHRSLAYSQLGLPINAWVGRVGADTGPWDEMHAKQIRKAAEELAAFGRYLAKRGKPSRPFTFTTLDPEVAGVLNAAAMNDPDEARAILKSLAGDVGPKGGWAGSVTRT